MLNNFSWNMNGYIPKHQVNPHGDGGDLYDTDRFIDIKLSCREQTLQKLMDYDLARAQSMLHTYIRSSGMLCSVSVWAKKSGLCPL